MDPCGCSKMKRAPRQAASHRQNTVRQPRIFPSFTKEKRLKPSGLNAVLPDVERLLRGKQRIFKNGLAFLPRIGTLEFNHQINTTTLEEKTMPNKAQQHAGEGTANQRGQHKASRRHLKNLAQHQPAQLGNQCENQTNPPNIQHPHNY